MGEGNIAIHDRKRHRYRCKICKQTFSARRGTMFEGLRKPMELIVIVVTLLSYGCPVQAIVHAFGLDERTVASWRDRAGAHCEQVHHALVEAGKLDLLDVQADEIWVKGRNMIAWMGLAMMVSTRLWLAGTVRVSRDKGLADALMNRGADRPSVFALARVDGWVGGLSGQHSTRFSREGQEDGRSRSSLFRSVATPAHWDRDQADREKAGRGGHRQDGSGLSIRQRSCSSFGWGERAQYGLY